MPECEQTGVAGREPGLWGRMGNRLGLLWAGVMAAGLLAHGYSLRAAFFMDDGLHITKNEAVLSGRFWEEPFRQLSTLIFAVVYGIFGPSPVAFHMLTLGLHLTVTTAVFLTGRTILRGSGADDHGSGSQAAAFFAALIFACHPLLSEGVNYAQNASLQLVTLFTVLGAGAAWKFVGSGRWTQALAAAGWVGLASISKEVGFIFSTATVLMVVLTTGGIGWWREVAQSPGRLRRYGLVGALVLALLSPLLVWWATATLGVVKQPLWFNHFLTQGRLFWDYAAALVWPVNLCADHHVPMSGSWADIESVVKTGLVLFLAAGAMAGLTRPRLRLPSLLITLALIPMLARFAYVNKEFFVEYRMYPVLPWVAMAAGLALARFHAAGPAAARLTVAILAGTGIAVSASRSAAWSDPYAFAESIVRQYPTNLRARTALQKLDYDAGRWAAVARRTADVRAAMARIEEFNVQAPGGRKYELSMAFRCAMCSEHFYGLALAELRGSAAAIAHLTATIDGLRRYNPDFVNPEKAEFEVGRQLVHARELLTAGGRVRDEAPAQKPARIAEPLSVN